jgi:hypothetical protein
LDLALPSRLDKAPVAASVAQARARLGDAPLEWLFKRCAHEWGQASARKHCWRGLALYGADGTTVRVPDSDENRAHFGGQSGREEGGTSGYPLARVVTLMALRSHVLVDASFGPYDSEQTYAKGLWPQIPQDAVAIVDRNFLDAKILIPLARDRQNRHWLTRAKSTTAYKTIKKLGANDSLVELKVSQHARKANPTLPKTWTVRAIGYKRRGFKPQILLTSLLDHEKYPAKEIVSLYHERWEIELGFDEVKTELLDREETLRSRTPVGVAQELWALGLAYNLVRLEMERIAEEANLPPTRISFVMAFRLIQDEWMWLSASNSPGAIPRHLRALRSNILRFVLPPRRTHRSYPRAVKLKMSNYARKRPPLKRRGSAK